MGAYPKPVREAEGDLLLSLASDMLDAGQSSVNREMGGLLFGGVAARGRVFVMAPWREALHRGSLIIGCGLLAKLYGTFAAGLDGGVWPGWTWSAALAAPALLVVGQLVAGAG